MIKTVTYEFWYDYVKSKYPGKAKVCYMERDSFFFHVKHDFCKDIAENVDTRFDSSNYVLERPRSKGNKNKIIGLMKDELGRKTMNEFDGLEAKAYSYLIDDGSGDKKAKGTKKCVIKKSKV